MSTKVRTRFAPSPTGYLHVGNARTAIINYLFTKKHNGEFILRIDDTDLERSRDEYKQAILEDLEWLGLNWDLTFNQSSRLARYEEVKQTLISSGRLYACYETPEELEVKRKLQLSRGMPPIYDRSGLKLTAEQKAEYKKNGRKPHYRFLVNDAEIKWQDMVKGEIKYQGAHISDPVVIRDNQSMTYMLCSTVDDIDYNITHVVRGEDHVSNTAIQIQMFEALGSKAPEFAHLSLVKSKDDKISKREGGFEIASLRDDQNFEPMAINSFLALIGSSNQLTALKSLQELIDAFDISTFSKSPTTFIPEELELINHKLIIKLEYNEVKDKLNQLGLGHINEQFWLAARPNLKKITDIATWWQICHEPILPDELDREFLLVAKKYLPNEITEEAWGVWTNQIAQETGRKGKNLFMPLRLALTGQESGPELKFLLPLLSRDEIITRLSR